MLLELLNAYDLIIVLMFQVLDTLVRISNLSNLIKYLKKTAFFVELHFVAMSMLQCRWYHFIRAQHPSDAFQ